MPLLVVIFYSSGGAAGSPRAWNRHHRGERRNLDRPQFGRTFNFSSTSVKHRELGDHLRRNYPAFWGALASLGNVTLLNRPSSHSQPTNYMSDKKRKKSPEPARKRINLGTPINIGPLRFRPELNTDPQGNRDRSRRDSELQIDLIRLWRQMTATPDLPGSHPTKRRAKTKVIPPRKHRPVVLWTVPPDVAAIVPVGASDPHYYDRRSSSSLFLHIRRVHLWHRTGSGKTDRAD